MADTGGPRIQDLRSFRLPPGFRGRSGFVVLAWQIVQATLFRLSPQPLYAWRRFLLRAFGAKVGQGVLVRPTVRITYPWRIRLGDFCWIGDNAELYSLGEITVGANAVISQRSYLCAGSHDYRAPHFPITANAITIGAEAWLATDAFIAPGVIIAEGAVVGARSSVFKNVGRREIVAGSPAKTIGTR